MPGARPPARPAARKAPPRGSGPSTASAAARRKRQIATDATAAGPPPGLTPEPSTTGTPLGVPSAPATPAPTAPNGQPRAPGLPASAPSWLSKPIHGGDGTGLLLGFVAYAVALVFLRGGTAGVRAWAAAKFLNRTTGTAPPATLNTPGLNGQPLHTTTLPPGIVTGPIGPIPGG